VAAVDAALVQHLAFLGEVLLQSVEQRGFVRRGLRHRNLLSVEKDRLRHAGEDNLRVSPGSRWLNAMSIETSDDEPPIGQVAFLH
jgi:hypothetical protein